METNPIEILCHIFEYLDNKSIVQISYSCKLFRFIVISNEFWKNKKLTFQKIHKIYAFREKLIRAKYINTFFFQVENNVIDYELLENNFILMKKVKHGRMHKELYEIVFVDGLYGCVIVSKDDIVSHCKTKVLYYCEDKTLYQPICYFYDVLKKTKIYVNGIISTSADNNGMHITHNYITFIFNSITTIIDINLYLHDRAKATFSDDISLRMFFKVYELTHCYNNGKGILIGYDYFNALTCYSIEVSNGKYNIKTIIKSESNQEVNYISSIDDGSLIFEHESFTYHDFYEYYNIYKDRLDIYKIIDLNDLTNLQEKNKIISVNNASDKDEDKKKYLISILLQ